MYLKNAVKHFKLITNHKWIVFKLCCKVGEPWRGFWHDISKYSPTEFGESIKYYVGTHSPITEAKKDKGYSEAWLHHKGRNKHHYEYWYDYATIDKTPIIPYKYFVEMVCDSLAAGMTYKGKHWTKEYQLNYWMKVRETAHINPKIDFLLTKVYTDISNDGVNKVINKKNLEKLYNKYVG